jgi:hypothetical protein
LTAVKGDGTDKRESLQPLCPDPLKAVNFPRLVNFLVTGHKRVDLGPIFRTFFSAEFLGKTIFQNFFREIFRGIFPGKNERKIGPR